VCEFLESNRRRSSSDEVQPCNLSLFAAAKNSLARLPKGPELDKQCQYIDRLVWAIQSAPMIKKIRKSFKHAGIRLGYADDKLWARLNLANCIKVAHFTGQGKPSPRERSADRKRTLENRAGRDLTTLEFPITPIEVEEDQAPYQFLPEAAQSSDTRRT
jgi:hypothetical protein